MKYVFPTDNPQVMSFDLYNLYFLIASFLSKHVTGAPDYQALERPAYIYYHNSLSWRADFSVEDMATPQFMC